jgi:lipopolysaccharide/colanic/teichoic acid biosynthesis glycosyltransferase
MKRLFDVVAAVVALILSAPLLLLVGCLIRLDDGGPVLFLQTRLGHGRRPFTICKFRSMRDGRVTRVGRWLRLSGIDELPQLLNVLRGEMSGVGPRPLTAEDVARLRWDRPFAAARFARRPGLTGLAQLFAGVSARRSLACERLYGRRATLQFDLVIIGCSLAIALLGKRRVRGWLQARRRQPVPMAAPRWTVDAA